jgi:His/Glu/Gln/Arg/opine family amino acid ABC transporter permease subunit
MFDSFYKALKGERWTWYFEGLGKTMLITLGAILIGCLLGIIVALIKYTNKKYGKLKYASYVCDGYLAIFRGTPVYVQLLIMYLIVLVHVPSMWVAILTFGINSGAYVAEIIRAGILAVDIGQNEAGRSLGLSQGTTMIQIIMPQALKNILPAIGNEFISILKETSVIGFLGVMDLTRFAEKVITRTADVFYPYISVAIIYLVMVMGLNYLVKKLEKRLARSDRRH